MVPPGSDPSVIDFAKFGGAEVFSGSDPNESSGGAEVFSAVIQLLALELPWSLPAVIHLICLASSPLSYLFFVCILVQSEGRPWALIPHAAYPIEKKCLFSFICLCSNCCFSFVLFDLNHGPNQPGV